MSNPELAKTREFVPEHISAIVNHLGEDDLIKLIKNIYCIIETCDNLSDREYLDKRSEPYLNSLIENGISEIDLQVFLEWLGLPFKKEGNKWNLSPLHVIGTLVEGKRYADIRTRLLALKSFLISEKGLSDLPKPIQR